MNFFTKLGQTINIPVVLQILGFVALGLVFWKGMHGFWPSFGFVAGVLMVYIGRHYNTVYNIYSESNTNAYYKA